MVRRYFDFASATHRFLHQQTVEAWLQDLYDAPGGGGKTHRDVKSRTAVIFMIFAQVMAYPEQRASADETDQGCVSPEPNL